MATIMTTDTQYYSDIADAIRNKLGVNTQYKPSEMAVAINSIIVGNNTNQTSSSSNWSWGDETADGDATWWAELKTAITNMSETELKACLGKTKSVTLSSEFLGTTTHLVRCIGYNCDREINNTNINTLTFQTVNSLADGVFYQENASNDTQWRTSDLYKACLSYEKVFPGKDSIIVVSKGTCDTHNDDQLGSVCYYEEKVFIPSDAELGFIIGADWQTGKGYASSYDEFCKENTSKTAYQYYVNDDTRIKFLGDNSITGDKYWERSLANQDLMFEIVDSDGTTWYTCQDNQLGFAPAFAI